LQPPHCIASAKFPLDNLPPHLWHVPRPASSPTNTLTTPHGWQGSESAVESLLMGPVEFLLSDAI